MIESRRMRICPSFHTKSRWRSGRARSPLLISLIKAATDFTCEAMLLMVAHRSPEVTDQLVGQRIRPQGTAHRNLGHAAAAHRAAAPEKARAVQPPGATLTEGVSLMCTAMV